MSRRRPPAPPAPRAPVVVPLSAAQRARLAAFRAEATRASERARDLAETCVLGVLTPEELAGATLDETAEGFVVRWVPAPPAPPPAPPPAAPPPEAP